MQQYEISRMQNIEKALRNNKIKLWIFGVIAALLLVYVLGLAGYAYGVKTRVEREHNFDLSDMHAEIDAFKELSRQHQKEISEYEAEIAAITAEIDALKAEN